MGPIGSQNIILRFWVPLGVQVGVQVGGQGGANKSTMMGQKPSENRLRATQEPPKARPNAVQEPRTAAEPPETPFGIIPGAILAHGPMGYPPG